MLEITGFALLGVIAGIASGLLGIGGAMLIIPALTLIFGFTQNTAQGTTLALMIPPIGLLAAMQYWKAGQVNLKAAVVIALFFLIGGFIGGKIGVKTDPGILRKIFSVFMAVIAVRMFFE